MSSEHTKSRFAHFATNALHAGQDPEQWNSRAVIPPISLSTTFKQDGPGQHCGFEYSRSGNPTRNVAETCLAKMENGKHGFLFASGLGCSTTIIHLLKQGDHAICFDDVYGGTNRYFNRVASQFGVEFTMVDMRDISNVEKALRPNTKLVWVESPTNPTMKLVDIEALTNLVHAKSEAFVVVDNTFMSAYFQRPLDLGADVVMHSLTKYMNGHGDVVMGAAVVNRDELAEKLRFLQNAIGVVPSPFDCYMLNRSMKTLHVRMREHEKNGLAVARFLEKHPAVEKVLHPGLESHPQHELHMRQCTGSSGMVAVYIKGKLENASAFLKALKIFTLAESLGGFESLAEHPALMTHMSVPPDQRAELGISDTLIRLSVGIEDEEDLIEDLEQALQASQAV